MPLTNGSEVLGRDAQVVGISLNRTVLHISGVKQVEKVLEVGIRRLTLEFDIDREILFHGATKTEDGRA